jgi:hypothetical protein
MDSDSGRELYKFDRSLMERLSDAGMSMSQLNVQRRMRPMISNYIRYAVFPFKYRYEGLEPVIGQSSIRSSKITPS